MLGECVGLLIGLILGDGESLVGSGLGFSEGLLIGGLGFVAFLGGLTDGSLLFFEGLLDGSELLGGVFLGALDAAVSERAQFFVTASEGLEDVLGILLGGSEGRLLGVELGFQFGHAFGGGLAIGGIAMGGSEVGLSLGDLGVRRGEGGGDFGLSGSDLLGELGGGDGLDLGFEVGAALFELSEGGGSLGGGAGIAFSEGGLQVGFGFGDLGFGSGVRTLGGGSTSFVEGLADGVELGLRGRIALGEGGLHLLGGVDYGSDISLKGARSFDGIAVSLLHEALELSGVTFGDGHFAGGGQFGQRHVDLGRETEIEGARVVGAERRL